MNKEELREKRNRTIETLDDIKAVLSLDELYIDELEKENAELKSDNGEWEITSDKWKKVYELTDNQLTKAKEIIKDLLNLPFANNEEVFADVNSHLDRAEQFLSEVEK